VVDREDKMVGISSITQQITRIAHWLW